MGRAPVVLSDQWLRPEGPNWESFCLFVPERDAASVPRLLEERESEAAQRGLVARREWEAHFSPDMVFHRVVEQCLEIQRSRLLPEWLERQAIIPQLLRWRNLKEYRRKWTQNMHSSR